MCRLEDRFRRFADGQWVDVLNVSSLDADMASVTTSRRRRRERQDDLDRKAPALHLVHLGEVSSTRQALEGASAPLGTLRTLAAFTHLARRQPEARAYLDDIAFGDASGNPIRSDPFEVRVHDHQAQRSRTFVVISCICNKAFIAAGAVEVGAEISTCPSIVLPR